MGSFTSKSFVSKNNRNKFSVILLTILASGCASKQTDFRWVNPTVVDDYSDAGRSIRDDWAKKINDLPIELHGNTSNSEDSKAIEVVQKVIPDDVASSPSEKQVIISKEQRIVLYVDGINVPEKADFCLQEKRMRRLSVNSDVVTLRGAVCDGSALIAYAREAECSAEQQTCNLDAGVIHLKKSLIAALYPAPNLKKMRDIGAPAGW